MSDDMIDDDGAGEDFTEEAARGFIGRRYRSTARYSGIQPGSIGTVSDVYSRGGGRFGVDVTWDEIDVERGGLTDVERGGLTDGFSRADLALVFTGGPNKGRRSMVPLDGPDGLDCGRTRASFDRRLDELVAEVERYRDLCLRLTLGAGPYAGQPLLGGGGTADYLGAGVGAGTLGGHYCLWCGAIREADDRHSSDCPWPEVLEEARGAVKAADDGAGRPPLRRLVRPRQLSSRGGS